MRKNHWIVWLILLSVMLAACVPAPQPDAESAKPAEVPAKEAVAPTKAAAAPTQKPAAPATAAVQPDMPKPLGGCKVDDPSDALPIPPVTEDEWVTGDLRARVIIMEYSDFQ